MTKVATVLATILALGAFSLTACGENKWVKRASEIEKKACACKDAKCALEIRKMVIKFQKDAGDEKVAKSDGEKIKKHMTKAAACLVAVATKGAGKKK